MLLLIDEIYFRVDLNVNFFKFNLKWNCFVVKNVGNWGI